mmetsp:Transcript_18612/g.55063  ORF Transcript_18612/g.55063 Transcript_18612/m.55063 type:complete len:520 (-) Transcript_18612:114-1673(-)
MVSICGGDEDNDMSLAVKRPHPLADDEHLSALLSSLDGGLVRFGDEGYDTARLGTVWSQDVCKGDARKAFSPETHPTETWNLDSCGLPAAIATVADVADVQACVKYCAASGELLAVAGGRHSHKCMVFGSFVVDLQRMRSATFEERDAQGYLVCGGGALNGDAHKALDGTGFMMTLGHHPGTGLGGLVQQGGHGPCEKTMGLSIDALHEAEVVLADGTLKICSLENEPDLFWCIRGGCGNFGVVTRFTFKLYPFDQRIPSLQRVHMPIPYLMPSRDAILKNFRDNCEADMPRNITPILIMTPFPLIEVYTATNKGDTLEMLEPYKKFGKPVDEPHGMRDYIHECSWDILGPKSDQCLSDAYYPTSALLGGLPDEACDIIAKFHASMPEKSSLILYQLGGAAADVPKDATSVYHRDGKYWLVIAAGWSTTSWFASAASNREKTLKWVKELKDALKPYLNGRYGALTDDRPQDFFNDMTDPSSDPLADASWGANYARLRKLKKLYDPENLFRCNHNIKPEE